MQLKYSWSSDKHNIQMVTNKPKPCKPNKLKLEQLLGQVLLTQSLVFVGFVLHSFFFFYSVWSITNVCRFALFLFGHWFCLPLFSNASEYTFGIVYFYLFLQAAPFAWKTPVWYIKVNAMSLTENALDPCHIKYFNRYLRHEHIFLWTSSSWNDVKAFVH